MKAILKHAWLLYRQNFVSVAIIMLTVWIPCEFFLSWVDNVLAPDEEYSRMVGHERFADCFVGIIATSGIFYTLCKKTSLRPVTLAAAFRAGFRFWGRMFITRFIVGVGIMVGLLLLVIPGIYLMIRMAMCETLVVAEEIAGMDAARRSYELTKGKFWQILGWLLAGSIPAVLISALIYTPFAFVPGLDNWCADAIGSALSDIPLIFFYPLTWPFICD